MKNLNRFVHLEGRVMSSVGQLMATIRDVEVKADTDPLTFDDWARVQTHITLVKSHLDGLELDVIEEVEAVIP